MIESIKNIYQKRKSSIHGISYLYFSNTVMGLSGFLIVIILANVLDQNEYGNYKYVFSLVGILGALALTNGFRNIAIQSAAMGYDGILRYLFKANIVLSLPMLLGGVLIATYYLIKGNEFLGYSVIIATICATLANNGVILYGYLNGRKLYRKIFWLQAIQSFITISAIYITTHITGSLLPILIVSAMVPASALSIFIFLIQKSEVRNNTLNEKLITYGKQLNFLGVITTIMMHVDSILIFKIIGSQGLALYAIATPFVDRIIGFLKATYYFALPRFTEMGTEKAYSKLFTRSLVAAGVGFVLYIIYYISAPVIFQLFFPSYIQSIELSRLFAINIPIIAFSILPEAFLDSIIEIRNKYIIKGVVTITRITSLLILITPFGIIGVIWSEILARIIGILVTIILIVLHTNKPKT